MPQSVLRRGSLYRCAAAALGYLEGAECVVRDKNQAGDGQEEDQEQGQAQPQLPAQRCSVDWWTALGAIHARVQATSALLQMPTQMAQLPRATVRAGHGMLLLGPAAAGGNDEEKQKPGAVSETQASSPGAPALGWAQGARAATCSRTSWPETRWWIQDRRLSVRSVMAIQNRYRARYRTGHRTSRATCRADSHLGGV